MIIFVFDDDNNSKQGDDGDDHDDDENSLEYIYGWHLSFFPWS